VVFGSKRFIGQGATEYLVLLAVVLIIALVSIALLGFFPGMAADAKTTQTQSYWQSASPIAVIDGAGYETYNGGEAGYNGVKMVLRNNGANTIELLAITTSDTSAAGVPPDTVGWEYFSPELFGDGSYAVYLAPPRGNGFNSYTSRLTLAPGETITLGMSVPTAAASAGYGTRFCTSGTDKGQIEFNPAFYYRVKADSGASIEKKQYAGKPLALPCMPGDLS
jgi:archaellin